jgi:UDPglucose--hexose-1-phosphate uridylyltransferase
MNELRKDYLLNRFVIISSQRGKRPDLVGSVKPAAKESHKDNCPFCPEHWQESIPSYEGKKDGKTIVRVIPNKFSAVSLEGNPEITTHNTFYTFAAAFGVHEVVIDTPEHDTEFESLSIEHVIEILKAYQQRILALRAIPGVRYVSIFKNRGKDAGASIPHAHSQVIAYNILPSWINEELMMHYKYIIENGTCPYCAIIEKEKGSLRRIMENEHVVAFTPYASRFSYEAWIFPKNHRACITDLNDQELAGIAEAVKTILLRLDDLGFPAYNLEFHNAEHAGENFHFHIEILPRMATWAGFELETGTIINSVSPEEAAKFYRRE